MINQADMQYRFPPISLLKNYETDAKSSNSEYVDALREELITTLKAYKVKAQVVGVRTTPFAVMFDIKPDVGVSVKSFQRLRIELELFLAAPIEITGIGENQYTVAIAVKDLNRPIIGLRDILESKEFNEDNYAIPIAAGLHFLGRPFVFDLAETPHLLVAGTTGAGKSTFINDILLSILYTKSPKEVQMVLIDPKIVELSAYNGIPHLLIPVITDPIRAVAALNWVISEMNERYKKFGDAKVRTLKAYNDLAKRIGSELPNSEISPMPHIIVVVDELSDLMTITSIEAEEAICHLARMARATGIHLIIATQRPSSDVITNDIKVNIPCRASFTVVDWRESKTILDRTGAERLLGNGDMLYSTGGASLPIHAQAAYVSEEEIDAVIDYVRNNRRYAIL